MAIPVKLEVFEGPLDLLLHLIEKNKVDKNNNEVIVNMSEVDDRCIYDDIIVRKMIERIEICGKESIKILFKQ